MYLEKDQVYANGDNEYAFIHVTYGAAHERGAEAAWLDVLLESSIWRKEPVRTINMLHAARDRCTVTVLYWASDAVGKSLGIIRCLSALSGDLLSLVMLSG